MSAISDSRTLTSVSAQSGLHDAILADTERPPAVIFNRAAGAPRLLAYAHGQMVILSEVLRLLDKAEEENALGSALDAIVGPALIAIELACKALEGGAS